MKIRLEFMIKNLLQRGFECFFKKVSFMKKNVHSQKSVKMFSKLKLLKLGFMV